MRTVLTWDDLPAPPPGKTGWPWTQESVAPPLIAVPDGRAYPSISVVTPSFNQGEYLEETIRSILLQGYPDLEFIVIDGGSTDQSASILRRYEPWLSHWESEPDRGQPHAINKGLARATGHIFNWINSDDVLCPGALHGIAAAFGERDAVAGSLVYFGQGEEITGENRELSPARIMRDGGSFFQQPAIWLRRDFLQAIGGVNEGLHYAFDWDMAVRYFHQHANVAYSDAIWVRFRLHNASKTVVHQERFRAEMTTILQGLTESAEFAPLHALCRRLIARRASYAAISRVTAPEVRRPRRQLLRLALRQPRVMGVRFFWGALRQTVRNRAAEASANAEASTNRDMKANFKHDFSKVKHWLGGFSRPLRERYLQRPHVMKGIFQGLKMGGYLSSYHEGTYEIALSQAMVKLVEPGWTCLDVGANRGYFTLLLAKLSGQNGRVVAFEAHPGNAAQVRGNVGVNGFEARVRVENQAVSDGSCAHLNLFPGREQRSEEWNVVGHDVEGNQTQSAMQIPAISLDAYFPIGSRVDFVKMDIEGAEVQALAGMRRLLRECRPLVLIEFHGQEGWNSRNELLEAGYLCYDTDAARWLDVAQDVPVYQCLAVPLEQKEKIEAKLR